MKNFMIEIQNAALNKLMTALSDDVQISSDDDIYQAVAHIGKNVNREGEAVWVLNKDTAINAEGELVDVKDYGLIWLGHLVDTKAINGLAQEDHACNIHLPLGTQYFDFMCHFLAETVDLYSTS